LKKLYNIYKCKEKQPHSKIYIIITKQENKQKIPPTREKKWREREREGERGRERV
jgi:hypothetical protein